MNIQRILFPEILQGRRGDPRAIELYQLITKGIHLDASSGRPGIVLPNHPLLTSADINTVAFWLLCKLFKDSSGKTYYVPEEFAKALSKVDKAIPLEYLPEKFLAYIQFAENVLSDDTGYVEGGFISIGPASDVGFVEPGKEYNPDTKTLIITYINKPKNPANGPDSVYRFGAYLKPGKVSDLMKEMLNKDFLLPGESVPDEKRKALRGAIVRAMLNCVLYLHSQDPDLMKLRPLHEMSHTKRKEYKKTHPVDNLCTIPVTVLNWNYHTGKTYSVDSTTVQTHMRWQPCGPELSQVKLIWVKEHERTFKLV